MRSRITNSLLSMLGLMLSLPGMAGAAITFPHGSPGNIFTTNQAVSILVGHCPGSTGIDWTTTDYYGTPVGRGSAPASGKTTAIMPTTGGEVGYFSLFLAEMHGTNVLSSATTQFAIIGTPPAQTNSPYGVQTHFAQKMSTEVAPLLAEAGLTQIRDEQYWDRVEIRPGVFSFAPYGKYMGAIASNGLTPLITLDWGSSFHDFSNNFSTAKRYNAPFTTNGFTAFGIYAAKLLHQWGDRVPSVEVWNEYNDGSSNAGFAEGYATTNLPYNYYRLLQCVHTALKGTDGTSGPFPRVNIVGMAAVPMPDGFIRDVLRYGTNATSGNALLDIVSVHPYRAQPEGVDLDFDELRALLKRFNNGAAKPVWATEFSFLSGTPFQEPSYLVRMIAAMQTAGVARMYYYTAQDDRFTPYLGLLTRTNKSSPNILPNPVYPAYANAIRQLYGWKPAGRITNGLAQTSFVYRYTNGASSKYVVWGGSGLSNAPTTLTLAIGNTTATLTDLMGNASSLTATNGTITVPIAGVDPVFIAISSPRTSAITEAANPVLADSVGGYSATQGQGGWYYGTNSGAYRESSFSGLPWNIWSGNQYRWTPATRSQYPFVTINQMHPNPGEATIRRWRSMTNGLATISGTITAPYDHRSHGVYCTICTNGTPAFSSGLISNSRVINFNLPNQILFPGEKIDFVETSHLTQGYNATGWLIRITHGNTPANLVATAGDESVSLSWNATPGALGYVIRRSTANGGPYVTLNYTTTNSNFTDTGLSDGTTYYYVVASIDSGGESALSTQASATPR